MVGEPMELFAGGELECFNLIAGSLTATTWAPQFDTAFSACGLQLDSSVLGAAYTDNMGAPTTVDDGETLWSMVLFRASGYTGALHTHYDTTNRPSIRLNLNSPHVVALQVNASSNSTPSWVTVVSFTIVASLTYIVFSVQSAGLARLFVNGDEVGSAPTPSSASWPLNRFTLGSFNGSTDAVSQIGVTKNLSLVGARIMTRKPNAAGALSEMSGSYSNLAKTNIDDVTAVVSNASGQISTFGYQDTTTPSGLVMGGVHIWTRAKNDGTPPENLKAVCRVSGTNYPSANMNVSGGFGAHLARFPVNPASSNAWIDATFNAAEFGLESMT